jgi:hypothetical protein
MAAKRGRPPVAEGLIRKTVVTIKGTEDWRSWLEEFSKHLRTPVSTVVDHALIEYAKTKGFDKAPPER